MNIYHQSDGFLFNHDHVISILNFPVNDLCRDSIGNKLFGFTFSRSDEPIVIGVCGMRSADQDHRIVSEPILNGSFLESGPDARVVRLAMQGSRKRLLWCYRRHLPRLKTLCILAWATREGPCNGMQYEYEGDVALRSI